MIVDPPQWRFIVPTPTPSLNVTGNMNWHVAKRLKQKWAAMLAVAGAKLAPKATGRRRVIVERHSPRALDYDNLVGGAKKVVIDNIRDFGLVIDDKPAHADLVYRHVPTSPGERPWTLVIVEDLPA